MINFPTSLDTITNPDAAGGDTLLSVPHDAQHGTANDILEALEAKVGIDSSAVATSHDYLLAGLESDKAVNGANTDITSLQNVALYVGRDADNKLDWATDNYLKIKIGGVEHDIASISTGVADNDKLVTQGYVDDNSGGGALADLSDVVSATNTDKFALMANGTTGYVGRALVEADISDLGSYITISSSDTLTNKTIDGDVNTLSDIAVSSLKEGTDGQLITWGTNAEPTTVATGNNDQVLTSNGAGTAPTFQDAAGGGEWEYVSNLTWSDSETTQSFTSLTGGTYDYKIEWQGYGSDPSDTSGFIYFYLNNDDASGNYNYISHSVSDISYNQSQDKVILGKTKGNVVTYNLIQGQIIFQGNRVNSDYIGYYSLGGGSMDNRYGLINGIYTANADLASIYISPFSGKFTGKVKLYRKANSF